MTDEQIALARRAVACKGWRWLRGMAVRPILADGSIENVTGVVVWFVDVMPAVWWPDFGSTRAHSPQGHLLPDLSDPATLGCLLALVREAWGDPHAGSRWMKPDWKVLVQRRGYINHTVVGVGRTEAEALVRALEAAP